MDIGSGSNWRRSCRCCSCGLHSSSRAINNRHIAAEAEDGTAELAAALKRALLLVGLNDLRCRAEGVDARDHANECLTGLLCMLLPDRTILGSEATKAATLERTHISTDVACPLTHLTSGNSHRPPAKPVAWECEPLKAVVWGRLKAGYYGTTELIEALSSSSCRLMYRRIISSSRPTVDTK